MQRWFGDRPHWPLFTNLVGYRRQWNTIGSLKLHETIYFLKRLGFSTIYTYTFNRMMNAVPVMWWRQNIWPIIQFLWALPIWSLGGTTKLHSHPYVQIVCITGVVHLLTRWLNPTPARLSVLPICITNVALPLVRCYCHAEWVLLCFVLARKVDLVRRCRLQHLYNWYVSFCQLF